MNNYLLFQTNPRVLGRFLWKWQVVKDSLFKKTTENGIAQKNCCLINVKLTANIKELNIEIWNKKKP